VEWLSNQSVVDVSNDGLILTQYGKRLRLKLKAKPDPPTTALTQ